MGGRYVLEVSNSKYPQKPAGLYHLLCDAYLDCGIDVLIFGIGLFIRCSCYGRKYVDAKEWITMANKEKRFETIYTQGTSLSIVVDTETGVNYLVHDTGITPLLDKNGTVVITEINK